MPSLDILEAVVRSAEAVGIVRNRCLTQFLVTLGGRGDKLVMGNSAGGYG